MRAAALGMTMDLAAPELRSTGQANKHADTYSYGKTIQHVQESEPIGGAGCEEARGQTVALVAALNAQAPKHRPGHRRQSERTPAMVAPGGYLPQVCWPSSGDLHGSTWVGAALAGAPSMTF